MQHDPYQFEHSAFQRGRLIEITRKRGITSDELLLLSLSTDPEVQKEVLTCNQNLVSSSLREQLFDLKLLILRTTSHLSVLQHALDKRRQVGIGTSRLFRNIILNPGSSPTWEDIETGFEPKYAVISEISSSFSDTEIKRLHRKNSTKPRDLFVIRTLALLKDAPQDLLRHLSLSEDRIVRACVALNPGASAEILTVLSRDAEPHIRELATMHWKRTPEMVVRYLFDLEAPHPSYKTELFTKTFTESGFVQEVMSRPMDVPLLKVITGEYLLYLTVLESLLKHATEANKQVIKEAVTPLVTASTTAKSDIAQLFINAGMEFKVPVVKPLAPKVVASSSSTRSASSRAEPAKDLSGTRGHVYIAMNTSFPDLLKIGHTNRDIPQRMKELASGTGTPGTYICVYSCLVDNRQELERKMHQHFKHQRAQKDREFFRLDPKEAIDVLIRLSSSSAR